MSTATAQPATLLSPEEIDRLVADPEFRTDAQRKRQIADHLLNSPPEVHAQLRDLWTHQGFDPEENRFVQAVFGRSEDLPEAA